MSVITIPPTFVSTQVSSINGGEEPGVTAVPKRTYRIVLKEDEDGRIVVTCLDLKGIVTDGQDESEAIKNAYEAVTAMLESLNKKEEFNLIEVPAN